jgi:hypothetical protein
MRPAPATSRRRIIRAFSSEVGTGSRQENASIKNLATAIQPRQKLHTLTANQIAMAMIAATMAHHITGVTCFELPLRGESLAEWLNS